MPIPILLQNGEIALAKYIEAFGEDWVQTSFVDDTQLVRLKTLAEFRPRFEEPGRFLLIPSEEITSRHRLLPIHINVTNPRELVRPQTGSNVSEIIQKTMDAVQAQQKRTGQPMFPHLNHPNFGWGITAEDMMAVRGEKFFEVYNGHPTVHNEGDAHHVSTDRMWDILLTFRLTTLRLGPVYGLGVDDCHHYHTQYRSNSIPGRGWIWVRSATLKTESLIAAMEAGDFYASSGVRLKDVKRDSTQLALEIDTEPEVSYVTKFIGTRTGFDLTSTPGPRPTNSVFAVTRRYSSDIGTVLATVPGNSPSYKFKGDEIYVRAQVISSKAKVPMITAPEMEAAWVQPVVLFPKR